VLQVRTFYLLLTELEFFVDRACLVGILSFSVAGDLIGKLGTTLPKEWQKKVDFENAIMYKVNSLLCGKRTKNLALWKLNSG